MNTKPRMILAGEATDRTPPLIGSGFVEDLLVAEQGGGQALPKVTILAYTGGVMAVRYWNDVILDLEGAQFPDQVKLLAGHDAWIGGVLGHGTAEIRSGKVYVTGVLSRANPLTEQIIQLHKGGVRFEASVGVHPLQWEGIAAGEEVTVSGRTFKSEGYGLTVVRAWRLRETSILPLGADDRTSVNIAARAAGQPQGGSIMKFEDWLKQHGIVAAEMDEEQMKPLKAAFDAGQDPPKFEAKKPEPQAPQLEAQPQPAGGAPDLTAAARREAQAAIDAERKRIAAIQDLCAGQHDDIEREAIRSGAAVADVTTSLLKAMREARPQAGPGITVLAPKDRRSTALALEAGLSMRAGIAEDLLVKEFGEQTMEAAYPLREISLREMFVECARMEGKTLPRVFDNDTIRAAFSTVSLPGILNNVANKRLLRAYQAQAVIAVKLCSEGDLNDFKESERYRLNDVGDLQEVPADGELKHGQVSEDKATNQLATYGKIFALTRQMIFNDDMGAFLRVPDGMGARAARKVDQLFFTRLLSNPTMEDGVALFHATHANYSSGASTALDVSAVGTAVQMFLDQTDADSQPINIQPKFLMVPTALKMTGSEILNSTMLLAVGGTTKSTRNLTYNAIADENLQLVAAPYLSNSNYTGYSALAWYLWGDPAVVDTFEIGYLRGKRTPTVEQGEVDFNMLGIQFRVYFDLGIREQDHRGVVKMKGEA